MAIIRTIHIIIFGILVMFPSAPLVKWWFGG